VSTDIDNASLLAVLRAKARGELKGRPSKWRDPWALAALLRPSRKQRNEARYNRKLKHKTRGEQ